MKTIAPDEFDNVDTREKLPGVKDPVEVLSSEELSVAVSKFDKPLDEMKGLAVKLGRFVNERIDDEMREERTLSDNTRRWVKDLSDLLEKIHKAEFGEKSVVHSFSVVGHVDIAARVREASKVVNK